MNPNGEAWPRCRPALTTSSWYDTPKAKGCSRKPGRFKTPSRPATSKISGTAHRDDRRDLQVLLSQYSEEVLGLK